MSQLKKRAIVWSDAILKISVISRPIIEVYSETKDLTCEQGLHINALFQKDGEVF